MDATTVGAFFESEPMGPAVHDRILEATSSAHPDVTVRVTRSQVAFRRDRGFALLWLPGRYLRQPTAPLVLSIATHDPIASPRFKEVVHPGPWMHHLEVHDIDDIDDEVLGWLRQAADEAGS